MSSKMIDKERLEEMTAKLAKGVKSEEDLADPLGKLMKLTIEKALNTEMEEYLGDQEKGQRPSENSRNGYSVNTGTKLQISGKNIRSQRLLIPFGLSSDKPELDEEGFLKGQSPKDDLEKLKMQKETVDQNIEEF